MEDGGPAFPRAISQPGMSLRDYFAAAAMEGYCAKGIPGVDEKIAEMSYEMADAMLKARG